MKILTTIIAFIAMAVPILSALMYGFFDYRWWVPLPSDELGGLRMATMVAFHIFGGIGGVIWFLNCLDTLKGDE